MFKIFIAGLALVWLANCGEGSNKTSPPQGAGIATNPQGAGIATNPQGAGNATNPTNGMYGSCTVVNSNTAPGVPGTSCTEYLSPVNDAAYICKRFMGTWSENPCDRTLYSKGCKQSGTVTTEINGNKTESMESTISWTKDEANIGCFGETINKDGSVQSK